MILFIKADIQCQTINQMLTSPLQNFSPQATNIMETILLNVAPRFIRQLSRQLDPNQAEDEELIKSLFQSIVSYCQKKKYFMKYEQVIYDILQRGKHINEDMYEKLKILFQSQFKQLLKDKFQTTEELLNKSANQTNQTIDKNINPNTTFINPQSTVSKAKTIFNPDKIKQSNNSNNSKPNPGFLIYDTLKSFQKTEHLKAIQKFREPKPLTLTEKYIQDLTGIKNLNTKKYCLCLKLLADLNPQKQNLFQCIHCKVLYHTECMKKKNSSLNCSFCHLAFLTPNRRVVKTVFTGLLKKGVKRHQIAFSLVPEDISSKYKIQIRCFRLKQNTQNSVLFPDVAVFQLNGVTFKQLQPLNKQSCLKYRKDEPIFLLNNLLKQNKLIISEKISQSKEKEVRCEAENHLLGIYVIEEKKVDEFVSECLERNMISYEQSDSLLQSCFNLGSHEPHDITCELVKIPLNCTLTMERIKIPARGIFCTHYQCFDLRNYFIMISESNNPRWKCPLCNQPAYQFKVDCVVMAILKEYQNLNASDVLFFKNGNFQLLKGEEPLLNVKMNISGLSIEANLKRSGVGLEEEGPKKKLKFVLPEDVQLINLD